MHNKVALPDGKNLQIVNTYDPNSWSLELATVAMVSEHNTFLKPGDRVLVDYGIYTMGLFSELQMTKETRFVLYDDETERHYYYCNDGDIELTTDPLTEEEMKAANENPIEIFAKIEEVDIGPQFSAELSGKKAYKLVAAPSLVIIEPVVDPWIKKIGSIYAVGNEDPLLKKAVKAKVVASSIPELTTGDTIHVNPESSIPIRFKGRSYEYIGLSDILAKVSKGHPLGLELISYQGFSEE